MTDVSLNTTGIYSGVTKKPYSTFEIDVTDKDGNNYSFEVSFSNSDSKFISKVLGSSNFSKDRVTVPIFVEERYQSLLNYGWRKGFIRGLNVDLTALPDARQGADPTSQSSVLPKAFSWFLQRTNTRKKSAQHNNV